MAILKAGIQHVGCEWRWCELLEVGRNNVDYLLFGMEYGIFLQDAEGTDFREFLVMLLSFYWKRNVRRRPRMLTGMSAIEF
jgi:hypothetical protein